MKMKKYILPVFAILALFSCKDETIEPDDYGYTVPSTYNFENVSYSGQTARLDMLAEITAYAKTGATPGTALDAQKLKDMFSNTGNPFNILALDTSGKQLQNKCFELDTALFLSYFDSLENIGGTTNGSNGVAGIVANGTKSYLCNSKGLEYAQLIDKGLMGAVFFYQVAEGYLSEDKIGDGVDNVTVTPGKGTPREHHFDEAFGYFGAPTNFPTNTDDARFWAKYSNTVNGQLGTNQKLMDAWLKGRAAISNNDKPELDAAVISIKKQWELVTVGTALHYLNGAIDNIADDAVRNHELSEAIAFIGAIKYNGDKAMTNLEIAAVIATLGDNLYEVSVGDINNTKAALAAYYGLTATMDQF